MFLGHVQALGFFSLSGDQGQSPARSSNRLARRGEPWGAGGGWHILWGAGVKLAAAKVLLDEMESREEGGLENKEC